MIGDAEGLAFDDGSARRAIEEAIRAEADKKWLIAVTIIAEKGHYTDLTAAIRALLDKEGATDE